MFSSNITMFTLFYSIPLFCYYIFTFSSWIIVGTGVSVSVRFTSTAPFWSATASAAIVVAAATAFIALWWDAARRRWSAWLGFTFTEIFWFLEQMIVETSRWALVWRLWRASTLPATATTHYILISLCVVIAFDAFATHFLLKTIVRTCVKVLACVRTLVSQIRFISFLALLEKRTLSRNTKIKFVKTKTIYW